jgi:gas vesicle protein
VTKQGSGDFMLGFFLGSLFGTAIALLFTPYSGQQMREQIREKSIELKDRAEDLTEEANRRVEEARLRGQSMLEQQKARFQEAIEEGKRAAAQRKEDLLSQLENTKPASGSINLTKPEV